MTELVPCAGAIVHDAQLRVLLIRRAHPPSARSWSIPGGRCLPGESTAAACVREVREETGLQVEIVRFAGRVDRPAPSGAVYAIDDFACRMIAGELRAGDDALDARWVARAELAELDLVPGLYAALEQWGLLPA